MISNVNGKDERIARHARVMTEYSAVVGKGDIVEIVGTPLAAPLLTELYRQVLLRGGHPLLRVSIPGISELHYRYASDEQLAFVSKVEEFEAKNIDVRIVVLSESNLKALSGIDPKRQAIARRARRPLMEHILSHVRWSLTLFPTEAYAQEAEMSLGEFEDFVYGALFVDKKDPVRAWRRLHEYQDRVIAALKGHREVRILGPDTDLTLNVRGRVFINSSGTHNMPSGEVFTGPVEDSARGHIRFNLPAIFSGRAVEDVFLRFEDGKVVEARAGRNQEFLDQMLALDPGARYLGELGIGTNFGIRRFTRNILFDEKIGGSVHLALGASYPETGGRNRSALHWDMIKDLRDGGEIRVDGEVLQRNGKFLL